jgi:hypothetical protein
VLWLHAYRINYQGNSMTPQQMLQHAILMKAVEFESIQLNCDITADNVDELYEANDQNWELQDARNEIRYGQVRTGLECDDSRHYESEAVAAQMPDGSWVGWTYWFGGGKHGEPEAIDWMDDAYFLDCKEEEKVVTVRTFTAQETA